MAIIRSEGRKSFLESADENTRNGDGRGGGGGVKLFRSSNKNLDGGGISVIASSISCIEVLYSEISCNKISQTYSDKVLENQSTARYIEV